MAKRRANNEGSIYQDKKTGKIRVQITAPDGSRPSKRFDDPNAAVAWKTEMIDNINKNKYVVPSVTTVGEYMYQWLEDEIAPPNKRIRTYKGYKNMIDKHLQEIINVPIQNVLPYHIKSKVFSPMRKKGLSESTVLKMYNILHHAFSDAKINKVVQSNIMEEVDRPKPSKAKVKVNTTDATGIKRIIKTAEGHRIYAGIYLIGNTALRLGEILGLQWDRDIIWDENKIRLLEQLQRIDGVGLVFSPLKTDYSYREIDVGDDVMKVLWDERQRQLNNKLLKDSITVICNNKGKPMEPRRFAKEFNEIAKKAGINVHRHGLRHSVASVLIKNGVSAADVSELLGHADEAFTYKQYVHPQKDATKKATSTMHAALNPKKKLVFSKLIRKNNKQPE